MYWEPGQREQENQGVEREKVGLGGKVALSVGNPGSPGVGLC